MTARVLPLILSAGIALAGGHRAAIAAEATPFSDDWLQDKSLVSARYVRDRWEELQTLTSQLRDADCPGFIVTGPGENGGRTRNLVGCVFRVSPVTAEKIRVFHTRVTSLGFHLEEGEPRVLAYKVSSVVKAQVDTLVSEARRKITARLPDVVQGLRRSRTRDGTDTYHYPKQGFICLAFDDLSSKMSCEMRSCGPAMTIHLPSLGYMIQVFAAKEAEPSVDPGVLRLVRTEVSELVRLDSRARISYAKGE